VGKFAKRTVVAQLIAVFAVLMLSGVAAAVSGGGYHHNDMDCTGGAEAYDRTDAENGCHSMKINVESGDTRLAEFGIDQTSVDDGQPHKFCAAVNTAGTGGGHGNNCGEDKGNIKGEGTRVRGDTRKHRITQENNIVWPLQRPGTIATLSGNGLDFYFGADDNLSGGEHDGVDGRKETGTDGLQDGPSDGGAIKAFVHPQDATTTPTAANPFPLAGASFGSCADGICENVTTYRMDIYSGGGSGEREVSDYDGKRWDPFECDGASLEGEQSCDSGEKGGPKTLKDWQSLEGRTYADPGVSIYEDPDPQGSPLDPIAEIVGDGSTPLYPLPGFYVGTCGLIVNGERQGPDTCA
jgi:hypothetical protein